MFSSEKTFVLQWLLRAEIYRILENTEILEMLSHLSFFKISSIISKLDRYTKPNAQITLLEVFSLREFQQDLNLINVNSEDLPSWNN